MPRLNRKLVLDALKETVEHIQSAIAELEKGNTSALENYIPFIYLDLNRAWNARFLSDKEFKEAGAEIDRFPADVDLG